MKSMFRKSLTALALGASLATLALGSAQAQTKP